MRKTVDEWLGSHQNGQGMAKKKSTRRNGTPAPPAPPAAVPVSKKSLVQHLKKKRVGKKSSRKRKPR
jgi:hypothetical protein